MACTKIMARSTSGDDFMHLKNPTSNLEWYYETTVHFEAIHEKKF